MKTLTPYFKYFRPPYLYYGLAGLILILVLLSTTKGFTLFYKDTISLNGYPTAAEVQKATELYGKGDIKGAETIYRQVIANRPNDFVAWNGLGNMLRDQGNFAEAEEAYLKVITINPKFEFVYRNLLTIYQYLDNPTERSQKLASYKDTIETVIKLNSKSVNVFDAAISYYKAIGDTVRADELTAIAAKLKK